MSRKDDLKNRVYTKFVWQWVNGVLTEVPDEARWYQYEGPVAKATGMFTVAQNAYRFYADDGSESTATALGSQDTAYTLNMPTAADAHISLRIRLQETGGAAGATTDDYQLQRQINASGTWVSITTSTTYAAGFNSSNLTDQGATTNRLGAGTGSFVAGLVSEDGLADNKQLTTSNYTELLFALTIPTTDAGHGDQIRFRILLNGATIGAYNVTPTLNIDRTNSGGNFGDCKASFQNAVTSITNPFSATGSISVSVGDLIVASITEESATATTTGVTDNLGNTYSEISAAVASGSETLHVFYSRVTTAGTLTSVDAAATASTNNAAIVANVFTGPFASSPLDANPTAITTDLTTPFDCPSSGTLAQADELVLGISGNNLNVSAGNILQCTSSGDIWVGKALAPVLPNTLVCARVVSSTSAVAQQFSSQGGGTPTSNVLNTLSFKKASNAGAATGAGAASATGASTAASPGSQAGIGAASATGNANFAGVAASSGTGSASGVGVGAVMAVGSASASGDATGVPPAAANDGNASGVGAAAGVGAAIFDAVGSASGTGDAPAVGIGAGIGVGSAAGTGTASGVSGQQRWDSANKSSSLTLSNGDLTFTATAGSGRALQGKYPFTRNTYFEVACNNSASKSLDIGVCQQIANFDTFLNGPACGIFITATSWTLYDNNAVIAGGTLTSGDHTVRVAYDPTNNKAYFGIDGTWVVGDPAAGTGGRTPNQGAGTYYPGGGTETSGAVGVANFGSSAFAYAAPLGYAGFEQTGSVGVLTGTGTSSSQGASNVNIGGAAGVGTALADSATRWDSATATTGATFSNNGLTLDPPPASGILNRLARATKAIVGKKYFELSWTGATGRDIQVGLGQALLNNGELQSLTGNSNKSLCLVDQTWGDNVYRIINYTTQVVGNTAISTGAHVLGVAYDSVNKKAYISLDGTWLNGGDPAAGTGGITPLVDTDAPIYPVAQTTYDGIGQSSSITGNFGMTPLTYPVPSGYQPLDTPDHTMNGAAAGTGTASAVGASIGSGVGAASASGVADGVAASTNAGTASGVGAAAGVGAALFSAVGSSSASGVALGVASSDSVGNSSGIGSAAGVGNANFAGVGSAAGSGAAQAAAQSSVESVGSATGAGAASGIGASTAASIGSASASGVASGVGAPLFSAVGASAGTGAATATGQSTAASVGAAQGTGAASAVTGTVGQASGTGQANGIGASTAASVGSCSASGNAAAIGAALDAAVGAASGAGAASATGAATAAAVGSAAGVGAAAAVTGTVGQAAGTGTAAGAGAALAAAVGAASASGAAAGAGTAVQSATGAAQGLGAAAGTGKALFNAVGSAQGLGAAAGAGASTARSVGSASASGSALGAANANFAGIGSASGTGAAPATGVAAAVGVGAATGAGSAASVSTVTAASVGEAQGAGAALGIGHQVGVSTRRKITPGVDRSGAAQTRTPEVVGEDRPPQLSPRRPVQVD